MMTLDKSAASPVPDSSAPAPTRRLTISQTAAALGINVGEFFKLRNKNPDFPKMTVGAYAEAEVSAWKKRRDEGGAP